MRKNFLSKRLWRQRRLVNGLTSKRPALLLTTTRRSLLFATICRCRQS